MLYTFPNINISPLQPIAKAIINEYSLYFKVNKVKNWIIIIFVLAFFL